MMSITFATSASNWNVSASASAGGASAMSTAARWRGRLSGRASWVAGRASPPTSGRARSAPCVSEARRSSASRGSIAHAVMTSTPNDLEEIPKGEGLGPSGGRGGRRGMQVASLDGKYVFT
eukprot:scaffold145130_cov31-Tisochrysis_lutea.AAC.5